jgi:multisubunit Na+/H+ antiporter MnhB subunit
VIPAVKSDSFSDPDRAVPAFWVNVGLTLLAAVACGVIANVSKERSRASTSSLVVIGLVVLMLGLALVDAASAYGSHGPSMQGISALLFVCAGVDILVGITFGIVTFLSPKRV